MCDESSHTHAFDSISMLSNDSQRWEAVLLVFNQLPVDLRRKIGWKMRCGFTDQNMARARCPRREIIDRCASGPSKRVANRDAIGGRPNSAQLEKNSYVKKINFPPDKKTPPYKNCKFPAPGAVVNAR